MQASETTKPPGLRFVALLELAKGALVLLVGFGLLTQLHRDTGLAAEELVRLFHLNPASHTPSVFIEAAAKLTDARLWLLAAAALGYALVRVAEAYGLWRERAWAEWFGVLAGGVYLPIELYELHERVTWARATVLAVNLVVVGILALALRRRRQARLAEARAASGSQGTQGPPRG